MTTDIIKNFYVCAYEASEILETTFGRHLDIGEFDEFVYSLYTLSDVDIEKCHNLIKETISWKDYFHDMNEIVNLYLDKFVCVKLCYETLCELMKNNKIVPKNLLIEYKIKSNTVGDIFMELSQKEAAVNDKIQKLKIFSSYLDSYINYLNQVYFKLFGIVKGYGSRYWNVLD